MYDVTNKNNDENDKIFNILTNKYKKKIKILILKNKIDKLKKKENFCLQKSYKEFYISVKKKIGLNEILKEIKNINKNLDSCNYIINNRHFDLFIKSQSEIKKLKQLVKKKKELILIAESIKYSYIFLTELLGCNIPDKLIQKIFSNFCIGK
jgi:tRNA U34 5-carboxymethylaminomethyl modifying GTPase MnmE/TrmE